MHSFLNSFFHFDRLAILMIPLVIFMGLCILKFAATYMKGDKKYNYFFLQLISLIFCLSIMVSANHLVLLLTTWFLSNMLLVNLMIHKSAWKAAYSSGVIAAKNYLLGTFCLLLAFLLLYFTTGELHVKTIIKQDAHSFYMILALILILIGALTQSALWPFHRWLLSSLNSPTPISAIMHAGLINGGGFLLIRFSPLYLQHSKLLTILFIIGLTSALLGTLWKLMQNDIKRMLACSTMGQMGFMLAQCGLGLFPAAVAHLIFHSMFKAYLFLKSGSAVEEKKLDLNYPPKLFNFICALMCGIIGSLTFGYISGKSWLASDTTLVLMIVTFIASSQLALTIIQNTFLKTIPLAIATNIALGLIYGSTISFISWIMDPMKLMQPQALNIFHILGIIILILSWLSILFIKNKKQNQTLPSWVLKTYVNQLNASQPHPSTITTYRNHYQY